MPLVSRLFVTRFDDGSEKQSPVSCKTYGVETFQLNSVTGR